MIYLLIDSRRKLSVDDQSFLDFVKYYELPVTVIFTKADKLNQSLRAGAIRFYKQKFMGKVDAIFTSSQNRENIDKLQAHIRAVIEKH
jgi:GTP-binding protein